MSALTQPSASPAGSAPAARRPRTLAEGLVEALGDRIREGQMAPGDKLPSEAAIMEEFSVSRTVVREAISRLQAAGWVQTRHGIGTFVLGLGEGSAFRIPPEQVATLHDVIAVLELRIGLETEAAALAAQRRTEANLLTLRAALDGFALALEQGRDAVGPDFQFHLEVARATQNPHYAELMTTLGAMIIPRARLAEHGVTDVRPVHLERAQAEHESIFEAIRARDSDAARAAMRTHLANSRERRRRAAEAAVGQASAPLRQG